MAPERLDQPGFPRAHLAGALSSPPSAPPPRPSAAPLRLPSWPLAAQPPPPQHPQLPPAARATRSSTRAAALHRTRAVQPRALMVERQMPRAALIHLPFSRKDGSSTRSRDVASGRHRANAELRDAHHRRHLRPRRSLPTVRSHKSSRTKVISIVAALALVAHQVRRSRHHHLSSHL
jgi:hypothetical protein